MLGYAWDTSMMIRLIMVCPLFPQQEDGNR